MKRSASCLLLSSLAGLAIASPTLAQLGCNDCPLDEAKCEAPDLKVEVDPGGKEGWRALLEEFTYTPDRRPGYIIMLGTGSTPEAKNPHGLNLGWLDCNDDGEITHPYMGNCYDYPLPSGYGDGAPNGVVDAIDWLHSEIDRAISKGFRRIMFMYPTGAGAYVPSSAWWSQPEWKQDAMSDPVDGLAAIIADVKTNYPDVEFSVYLSIMINDDLDACDVGIDPLFPTYSDTDEMQVVLQNFKPWMDIGIDRIWSDFVSGPDVMWTCSTTGWCADSMLDMLSIQMSPDYSGNVKFGFEAWSVAMTSCTASPCFGTGAGTWDGQEIAPLDATCTKGAYIQTSDLLVCGMPFDPDGTWHSSWDSTSGDHEFNLMLALVPGCTPPNCGGCPTWLEDMKTLSVFGKFREHGVYTWFNRNYEFQSGYADQLELMERVYDFGIVDCAVDFNLDGIINSTDVGVFINQWTRYENCGVTFWEGDYDDDDDVDQDDMDLFIDDWFLGVCNTKPQGAQEMLPAPCP